MTENERAIVHELVQIARLHRNSGNPAYNEKAEKAAKAGYAILRANEKQAPASEQGEREDFEAWVKEAEHLADEYGIACGNTWGDPLNPSRLVAWDQLTSHLAARASLRASPAVPVAQDEREIDPALLERVKEAIAEALGDAYDCTRVWRAWGVGTMSQDDFVPVAEQGDRLEEIARAALSAATPPAAPICWAMACSNRLEQPPEWLERAQPAVSAEPDLSGLPAVIAGALFDFAGYLTTRDKVIEVGSTAMAGPVADLLKAWASDRGLRIEDAAVLSWQELIAAMAPPADKTWTAHEDCGMRHPEACDLMGGETDASPPPAVNIKCETTNDEVIGTTSLNVVRVEVEDDGSLTAVTDHWPTQPADNKEQP